MSLQGTAFLAIWQDLVPAAKADFYEWHNRQHVPERLSIPGFRRARRFVAVEGTPEFFTLYELDCVDIASGKAYLDRLDNPTDWTRRVMPNFRNMARSANRIAFSGGTGEGGYLATIRFSSAHERLQHVLPSLLDMPGIVGVHLGFLDERASSIATLEKTFRTADDLRPACVVMIEGSPAEHVRSAVDRLLPEWPHRDVAIYQLEHAASMDNLAVKERDSAELQHARV